MLPYSEMLTYKPLTNNAVLRKYPPKKYEIGITNNSREAVNNNSGAIYRWYRVNVPVSR